jgi:ribosomal protein S18 acetylase RimI-like enzyme
MQLQHRMAGPADATALASLNKHLIEDEGHDNPMTVPELAARMRRWLENEDYTGVLFSQSGTMVGYALYRVEDRQVYIRHFFVAREVRRSGIGRAMMQLLRDRILPRRRITLEVLSQNARARAFYRAIGFREYAVIMDATP